jgi:hypothetical protein
LRLNFEAQVGKRTSTDSNFAIHKEKEMNFRRWITALAVLALFAGFASAQVAVSTASSGLFQCQASVAVPPTLRAEGLTELIGDIVINCSGGVAPIAGSTTPLPTANFTVSLGANVTSRLMSYQFSTPSATTAANTSDALLLIDEPGSGLTMGAYGATGCPGGVGCPVTGYGPAAAQMLCVAPGGGTYPASAVGAGPGGCIEYAAQLSNGDMVQSTSATTATPAANVFAGVVSGNQVTFYGIPIMPPASAGVARIFRITNVRLNANTLAGAGLPGTQSVIASVAISSNTSVLVNSPTPIVGFIQPGLSTSSGLRNANNTGGFSAPVLQQCQSQSAGGTGSNAGILRFTENFGTAFKTRVSPAGSGTTATSGQAATPQNVPGTIYNSESGFVTTLLSLSPSGAEAGLADFGTRLKAVFNNVPTNVTIYVSTTNVVNLFSTGTTGTFGGMAAPALLTSTASYAQEVLTETSPEGNFTVPTGTVSNPTTFATVIGYAPVSINAAGQGVATWEVINTNSASAENFDFAVYFAYTAAPPTSPTPITTPATVTLSYAPTSTEGAFSQSSAIQASTLVIPRFSDAAASVYNLFTIAQCQTSLLFPFITNQAGFDTGIAIMNTSQDPFGSVTQSGTCQVNFYGTPTTAAYVTPIILPGNSWTPAQGTFMASDKAPLFEGYAIAVCNFQLAHGYSFVSDLGAQKLAHGSLALILPNGTSKRSGTESLMH